ncbi:MAG: response regulator [Ginsengibacter sp.]|jgi:DNA-binding response OmpR family regulator
MKKKLFVTDDDESIQDILRIIFESAGYETTIFSNGGDLMASDSVYPDVYILDKQLSGMDGLDICRILKKSEKTKSIPIIMVSASPDLGILAKKAGADDFIEKPFNRGELLDLVAKYAHAC